MKARELTCIVCPLGCRLEVDLEDNEIINIKGNGCKRGVDYAKAECTNPTRILTTTMKVAGGQYPLVSVKSEQPLPRGLLMQCIKAINNICVNAPVQIGDVIVENILNTGVNIVSTKNISACTVTRHAVRSDSGACGKT